MVTPVRLSAEDVREKTRSNAALLVCAYEENDKFTGMQLEGAIGWQQFQSILPDLAKDQEIIFYCA